MSKTQSKFSFISTGLGRVLSYGAAALLALSLAAGAETTNPALTDMEAYSIVGKAMHKKANPQWCHLDRNEMFPNVVLVNTFANDRGDAPAGVIVDGVYGDIEKLTPKALEAAGWADKSKRTALALKWASWALYGRSVLEAAPKDFEEDPKAPAFTKPETTLGKDGKVDIAYWCQGPTGMTPAHNFYKAHVVYSAEGKVEKRETVAHFSHRLSGHR